MHGAARNLGDCRGHRNPHQRATICCTTMAAIGGGIGARVCVIPTRPTWLEPLQIAAKGCASCLLCLGTLAQRRSDCPCRRRRTSGPPWRRFDSDDCHPRCSWQRVPSAIPSASQPALSLSPPSLKFPLSSQERILSLPCAPTSLETQVGSLPPLPQTKQPDTSAALGTARTVAQSHSAPSRPHANWCAERRRPWRCRGSNLAPADAGTEHTEKDNSRAPHPRLLGDVLHTSKRCQLRGLAVLPTPSAGARSAAVLQVLQVFLGAHGRDRRHPHLSECVGEAQDAVLAPSRRDVRLGYVRSCLLICV